MKKEVITHREPKSSISEVLRTLRTNIQFMNSNKPLRTLLFTSVLPSEGKSWVVANLAVTFAQADKRVLIIDADMRKARQHTIFGLRSKPGLSNYLSGIDEHAKETQLKLIDYIKETEVENLFLLPAGNVPPNPSELLLSNKTVNMIEELKQIFDVIIFDTPPSLLVTDAIILSRFVDSTIIVTTYKGTKIEDLKKIKRDIENVGGKIAGIVMNKVQISIKQYKNKYYYASDEDAKKSSNNVQNINILKKQNVKKEPNEPVRKIIEEPKQTNDEQANNNFESVEINTEKMLEELKMYLNAEKNKLKNKED